MKITIESTARIVALNGVPARIWEGASETGVPVVCFVTRISPQTHEPTALTAFDAEFRECRTPNVDISAIPLRFIL